jgi:hypothetical protein
MSPPPTFVLLAFILASAISPWGMALLFVAFLISCLSRVFLRSARSKKLYMIFSFLPLLYLLVLSITLTIPAIAPTGDRGLAVIFLSLLLVPISIGWLLGWPIAVLVQTAARGPGSATPGQAESN